MKSALELQEKDIYDQAATCYFTNSANNIHHQNLKKKKCMDITISPIQVIYFENI